MSVTTWLPEPTERSGGSVSGAGDANVDGLADVVVEAHGGNPGRHSYAAVTNDQ